MKKLLLLSAIFLLLASCSKSVEVQKSKTESGNSFDLLQLNMSENIEDILKSVDLSIKDSVSYTKLTLLGNENAAFNSDKLLVVNKVPVQNSIKSNRVIFHYGLLDKEIGAIGNEKDNIVGMCELKVFDELNNDKLFQQLTKVLGKAKFDTIINSNQAKVVDNTIVPTDKKIQTQVAIWMLKGNVYYYNSTLTEKTKSQDGANLYIFKQKDKEWKGFLKSSGCNFVDKIDE